MNTSTPAGERPNMSGDRVLDVEPDIRRLINVSRVIVNSDPDDRVERKSNMWIAAAYNITAIIGVGVLGLPNAMVFLTWYGGPVVLVLAFFMTYFTLRQLIKLHEFEFVNKGIRYSTYHSLGQRAFGDDLGFWIILPLQMVVEVSLDILFTVAAGEAMNRIHNVNHCEHPQVHIFIWFAVFATIQIVLSFVVPTFESIKWIVITAAIMSICYSTIAWITVVSAVNPKEHYYRLPKQLPVDNAPAYAPSEALELSDTDLVFRAFNAIGIIAFAYAAHNVVLEIQNGIPSTSRKSSETAMMRGVWITYVVVAICYFPMGIAVYAVHGNKISSNVLSFMFQIKEGSTKWVTRASIAANVMLIIHLVGSYQIFALPVFKQLEILLKRRSPLIIRPLYIVFTMVLAMVFPYFSPLLGFFGGFAVAPTTYFLPCVIWLCIKNPKRWKSKDWYFNWACIILGVVLMIVASIGGLRVLIQDWHTYNYYKLWTNWKESKYYSSCNSKGPSSGPSSSP